MARLPRVHQRPDGRVPVRRRGCRPRPAAHALPQAVEQSSLKQGGAYRFVRHPIYGGVLLLGLAWALVSSPVALLPWAAAGAFLDAKRRREEAWLIEKHPEYEDYKRSVRASFFPFLW